MGFRLFRKTSHSASWRTLRNYAGVSSAIIRSSNKSSDSGTSRGEAGGGFHHHATLCIAVY